MITRQAAATGVSLPLFGADRTMPAATVKIQHLGIGAQRKGFFRIGVLPQVVANDVRIIFQKAEAGALADLPATLEVLTKCSELELTDVKFLAPGATEPCLTASAVRLDGSGVWQLTNAAASAGPSAARARLYVTGEKAGEVTFGEKGTGAKYQLFTHP